MTVFQPCVVGGSEGGRGRRAVLELKGFKFGVDIVDSGVLGFGFGLRSYDLRWLVVVLCIVVLVFVL